MNDTIGHRLRKLKEEMEIEHNKKITDEEIAIATGVSRNKLNMVMNEYIDKANGKLRTLTSDEVIAICDYFDVSPTYLLTGFNDDNTTLAKELGLSNDAINELKRMDSDTMRAFETLITDPTFSMALTAYLSTSNQGLWLNGRQIAYGADDITLGRMDEYSGVYNVNNLVAYAREQDLIRTLRSIKERVEK